MFDNYADLVLALPFKDDLRDYSPYGHSMYAKGDVAVTDTYTLLSAYGKSLEMSGDTDNYVVAVNVGDEFNVDTDGLTISMYVTETDDNDATYKCPITNRVDGTAISYAIYVYNGVPKLYLWTGSSDVATLTGSTDISDLGKTHLQVSMVNPSDDEKGSAYLFINGVLEASTTFTSTIGAGEVMYIGYDPYNSGREWSGAIQEVLVSRGVWNTEDFDPTDRETVLATISNSGDGVSPIYNAAGETESGIIVMATPRVATSTPCFCTTTDEDGTFTLDVPNYYTDTRIMCPDDGYADICESWVNPIAED